MLASEKAARCGLGLRWTAPACPREGDHAQRCVIAHYLADLQTSLDDEVRWDQRALVEHAHVDATDLAPVGITSAAAMAPSLHLNLGDGYLRQGRVGDAEARLSAGLNAQVPLPAGGYGDMIRNGLDRLRSRVQDARKSVLAGPGEG